jgi:hypothetical protein
MSRLADFGGWRNFGEEESSLRESLGVFDRMGSRTDCGRCISAMHRGEELGLGKGLGGS